jgi:hypothetical protein
MRVNFVDGGGGGEMIRLVGTDGTITVGWGSVKVTTNKMAKAPGYGGWDSYNTFTEAQQKEYEAWYKANYPAPLPEVTNPGTEYFAPKNYSANYDHHANFYKGIRQNVPVVEDALFSMRAAGPALLANKSYYDKKIIRWDPENAKVMLT